MFITSCNVVQGTKKILVREKILLAIHVIAWRNNELRGSLYCFVWLHVVVISTFGSQIERPKELNLSNTKCTNSILGFEKWDSKISFLP